MHVTSIEWKTNEESELASESEQEKLYKKKRNE